MNAKPVGVKPRNKSRFDSDLFHSESDDALFPGDDGDPIEYNDASSWRFPEKLTSMKRRTRPTWQLIEDYKEDLRLKRALEEIDSDPFVAG